MEKIKFVFGIEPGRKPYRLRLARYHGIGEIVARTFEGMSTEELDAIQILDVGGDEGRILKYIEAYSQKDNITCDLVDLFPKGTSRVYKEEARKLYTANLEEGLPFIEKEVYDMVICEQVLEHLKNPELALTEISRILKPGGIAIIGVPTFPHGVHWIREFLVPYFDKLTFRKKERSHIQAFSKQKFLRLMHQTGNWKIEKVQGFRIISGGLIRFLENYYWWWAINRFLGSKLPSLCIEIQVVAKKE